MTNEEYEEILRRRALFSDNYWVLIEEVIDTLFEVGNGVTNEDLAECLEKMFRIRDLLEKEKKKNDSNG